MATNQTTPVPDKNRRTRKVKKVPFRQDRIDRILIDLPKGKVEASGLPVSALSKLVWLVVIGVIFLLLSALLIKV